VLTTGTFLRGVIHIGDVSRPGGRMGDKPSIKLAERLDAMDLPLGRLKTGTPPRLQDSIDWSGLDMQPADEDPTMFSFLSNRPMCGRSLAASRIRTLVRMTSLRRTCLGRRCMAAISPGVGPRYCPSIEDKIVRFADKESHQIFLEPEGLDSDVIYPNGISTSLPADVQEAYVRSIRGLERAYPATRLCHRI
jgi:tRNA uridine 5-carboxymethylaminomethyl modification enzyme